MSNYTSTSLVLSKVEEKLTLYFASRSGEVEETFNKIAQEVGAGERSVRRCYKSLINKGVLELVEWGHGKKVRLRITPLGRSLVWQKGEQKWQGCYSLKGSGTLKEPGRKQQIPTGPWGDNEALNPGFEAWMMARTAHQYRHCPIGVVQKMQEGIMDSLRQRPGNILGLYQEYLNDGAIDLDDVEEWSKKGNPQGRDSLGVDLVRGQERRLEPIVSATANRSIARQAYDNE